VLPVVWIGAKAKEAKVGLALSGAHCSLCSMFALHCSLFAAHYLLLTTAHCSMFTAAHISGPLPQIRSLVALYLQIQPMFARSLLAAQSSPAKFAAGPQTLAAWKPRTIFSNISATPQLARSASSSCGRNHDESPEAVVWRRSSAQLSSALLCSALALLVPSCALDHNQASPTQRSPINKTVALISGQASRARQVGAFSLWHTVAAAAAGWLAARPQL